MAALLSSLLCGLLFGIGLIVSGMVDPGKVIGFLDLAGAWDPSLALVMGGAIAVGLVGFGAAKRRRRSILGLDMALPSLRTVDRKLVIGSVMFGVGWGLAGICPGPGVVAAAFGEGKAFIFLIAMLFGMLLFQFFGPRKQ
ncbi:DUF6691 family protein [Burkholderiaceae bacterium UC74_6]